VLTAPCLGLLLRLERANEDRKPLGALRPLRAGLEQAGIAYQRPYDLRHSFTSLLLHEGRSVIYVARQLGHSAALTMRTYGHVIEELDEAPRISAEDAIIEARSEQKFGRKFGRAE
jgi:integrase